MTKQSGQLAGAPKVDKRAERKSEKGGSPLSGLFAEENEFDRRALWRIGSWGACAVGAVTLAVISNQWSLGLRREQVAAADLARQAQQIQSLAKESQNETRRLASAIETLNNDRDRLFSRVTVIEQGLDSVTGALAKQATMAPSASAAPQGSAAAQASNMPAGTPPPTQQNAAVQFPAPAPVLAPAATTAAASPATDKPRADTGKSDARTDASGTAATAASLMSKSIMGPPAPAAPKLIEAARPADAKASDIKASDIKPADAKAADLKMAGAKVDAKVDSKGPDAAPAAASEVVASVNAMDEPEAEQDSVAVKRTDFAVDLGTANSLGGLRALWRGVRHVNAELGALNPIVVIREGRTGLGAQLHLAAGPLKDAAAAAKICAALAETKRGCETTVYDGQRLAMKVDEPQSRPVIRAASGSKSDAKAEARPDAGSDETTDAGVDARVEANIDDKPEGKSPEGKSPESKSPESKSEGKTDPRSASSRRGLPKHAKKEEPAPPPAPPPPSPPPQPTSTFSSLFGRK
jgi:hypothetical protein